MGSYVSTHQKLCVQTRPDAHLGTQHTYPVSHPRDASPACGRCRGRLTDTSALLHVPPDPRSHQPGAGAMGSASFPRRLQRASTASCTATQSRAPGPEPRVPTRLPALSPRVPTRPRRLPRAAQTPPPHSSPASSSQAAGASAGAGRRSIAPAPGAAARPRRERQGRARGAERGSRGPRPAAWRCGEHRGPRRRRRRDAGPRARAAGALPSAQAALRWRQRQQLRWRRRSLSGPARVPGRGRGGGGRGGEGSDGGVGRGATARRARGAPGSARGVGWGRGARAYEPAGGAWSARPRGRAGDLGPREAGRGSGGCTPLSAAAAEAINSSSPRALTGPGAERELPWGPCLPFLPFPTPPQGVQTPLEGAAQGR